VTVPHPDQKEEEEAAEAAAAEAEFVSAHTDLDPPSHEQGHIHTLPDTA